MENELKSLEDLKKDYLKIQKKYRLPDFKSLNEDFQIERLSEIETDYLVREIRKLIADKFSVYLRFIESLLQPVNVPLFVFSMVRLIGVEEKEKLTKIYNQLSKLEVKLIILDTSFSEEKEIEFIKESYDTWQKIKKDLLEFLAVIENNWDNKFQVNGKSYFR